MDKAVKCPVCEERFDIEDDVEYGDTVTCGKCYEELRVVSTDPFELEQIFDLDYNDDSDEDEDEEDEDLDDFEDN